MEIIISYLYLGTFLIILTATCFPAYLYGEEGGRGREEGSEGGREKMRREGKKRRGEREIIKGNEFHS